MRCASTESCLEPGGARVEAIGGATLPALSRHLHRFCVCVCVCVFLFALNVEKCLLPEME